MKCEIVIYMLIDPSTQDVRHVGQTRMPSARVNLHVGAALRSARMGGPVSALHEWILGMRARGLKPVLEIVEVLSLDEFVPNGVYAEGSRQDAARTVANEAEEAHICRFRHIGAPLLNAGWPIGVLLQKRRRFTVAAWLKQQRQGERGVK